MVNILKNALPTERYVNFSVKKNGENDIVKQ